MLLDPLLGSLYLASEILDIAVLELGVRFQPIHDLCIAAQRTDQLFLAVELRAKALELQILAANFAPELRYFLAFGLERFDQLVLPRDPLLQRLHLAVAAGVLALERLEPGALLLELLEHHGQLGTPIGEQPS